MINCCCSPTSDCFQILEGSRYLENYGLLNRVADCQISSIGDAESTLDTLFFDPVDGGLGVWQQDSFEFINDGYRYPSTPVDDTAVIVKGGFEPGNGWLCGAFEQNSFVLQAVLYMRINPNITFITGASVNIGNAIVSGPLTQISDQWFTLTLDQDTIWAEYPLGQIPRDTQVDFSVNVDLDNLLATIFCAYVDVTTYNDDFGSGQASVYYRMITENGFESLVEIRHVCGCRWETVRTDSSRNADGGIFFKEIIEKIIENDEIRWKYTYLSLRRFESPDWKKLIAYTADNVFFNDLVTTFFVDKSESDSDHFLYDNDYVCIYPTKETTTSRFAEGDIFVRSCVNELCSDVELKYIYVEGFYNAECILFPDFPDHDDITHITFSCYMESTNQWVTQFALLPREILSKDYAISSKSIFTRQITGDSFGPILIPQDPPLDICTVYLVMQNTFEYNIVYQKGSQILPTRFHGLPFNHSFVGSIDTIFGFCREIVPHFQFISIEVDQNGIGYLGVDVNLPFPFGVQVVDIREQTQIFPICKPQKFEIASHYLVTNRFDAIYRSDCYMSFTPVEDCDCLDEGVFI